MIIALVILVVIFAGIGLYNSVVRKKHHLDSAFVELSPLFKKRLDLISRLVENVEPIMPSGKDGIKLIADLRTKAMRAKMSNYERITVENAITTAIDKLTTVLSAFPTVLEKSEYSQLSGSLIEIREQLDAAAQVYNNLVDSFNHTISVFPGSYIARILKYETCPELLISGQN